MASTAPLTTTQAISTTKFVSSIGVNTHLRYYDTAYGRVSIIPEMAYLGLNQARDGVELNFQGGQVALEAAMAAGIKFDLGAGDQTISASTYAAALDKLQAADPGGVVSVEGINESPVANLPAATAFQANLYAAIRADPALAGVAVATFTVLSDNPATFVNEGNISSLVNLGNTHSYPAYFPPNVWDSWFVPLGLGDTPGVPYIVTETGYPSIPAMVNGGEGVNADVQAKYMLDDVFDLIMNGASKAYIYELLDEQPDPGLTNVQDHFGLFNADGSPKEVATALHNLTTILADPGATAATFTPGSLTYSVTGLTGGIDPATLQHDFVSGILNTVIPTLPAYGYSMLLGKSDGSFDLAVWQEPEIWNGATLQEIAAPATPVTVTLGSIASMVKVFDPLLGTGAIASYANVSQVTLSITDHPLIVEIDPGTTAAAAASNASLTLTGTGNVFSGGFGDTITDAGTGDAVTPPAGSQATITGSNDTVTATSPTQVSVQSGSGGQINASNSAVAVAGGVGATVAGSGNTVTLGTGAALNLWGDNSLVLPGTGYSVSLNGNGDTITGSGMGGVYLNGSQDTIRAGAGSYLIVLSGSGSGVTESSSSITLQAGVGINLAGSNDSVAVGTGSLLDLDGDSNSVTTGSGGTANVAGNGNTVTSTGSSTLNLIGNQDSVTAAAGSAVNLIYGTAFQVTASGAAIQLLDGVGATLSGSNDAITLGNNVTAAISGSSNAIHTGITGSNGGSAIDTLVVGGASNMLFLGGAQVDVTDNSTALTLVLGAAGSPPPSGVDVLRNFGAGQGAIVNLLAGTGGYATAAAALHGVVADGAGGSLLPLGGGAALDFIKLAPSSLGVGNFHVGQN